MDFRVAIEGDVEAVTETIALAFLDDPIWGPALARSDGTTPHIRPFWRLFVEGSMRFGTAYLTPGATAVATWIPPEETELSERQEEQMLELLKRSLDADRLDAVLELFDRFDAAHPHDEPHAYLGILATHPDSRGHGIAQRLLAEKLIELDAAGLPAYLESSNPANDHRYERAGFRRIGRISSPLDYAPVSLMWRDAAA